MKVITVHNLKTKDGYIPPGSEIEMVAEFAEVLVKDGAVRKLDSAPKKQSGPVVTKSRPVKKKAEAE